MSMVLLGMVAGIGFGVAGCGFWLHDQKWIDYGLITGVMILFSVAGIIDARESNKYAEAAPEADQDQKV